MDSTSTKSYRILPQRSLKETSCQEGLNKTKYTSVSHSVEERDVIYYPRESPQIRQIEIRVKSKFCSDFLNFDERTFKSQFGTHGGLLNHVEKEI